MYLLHCVSILSSFSVRNVDVMAEALAAIFDHEEPGELEIFSLNTLHKVNYFLFLCIVLHRTQE